MKKRDLAIFDKLSKSEILKQQKTALASQLKHPIWHLSSDIPKRNEIKKHLINIYKKARRRKRVQKFEHPRGVYGFVLPLVQGNKIYGYISLYNIDTEIPDGIVDLFKLSLDTTLTEIQKELELTELYETIRPRAIALSTIHTIHRLISSTLDIDELLPRIARLSVQVMRANRCSIKLLDEKKKMLIPNTTVDIRKNKRINLRNLPVGKGIPGKAVKRGKALRGKSYLSVPLIDEDIIGIITVYDKTSGQAFTPFDQEILTTLAEQAVIAIKNAQLYKEQQDVVLGSIKSLAIILSTQAPHMYRPSRFRVKLTLEVGREMGMNQEELKSLEVASMLHDAGQVSVPNQILTKRRKLTGKEYEMVKEHPLKGVKIIEPLKALSPAIPMIMHHHEKYDGTGYPEGLKGDEIPLGARIMAVTGAFEAMVVLRPYRRRTKTIDEAIAEITRYSNKQFDPKVITAFVKVIRRHRMKKFLENQMKKEHII